MADKKEGSNGSAQPQDQSGNRKKDTFKKFTGGRYNQVRLVEESQISNATKTSRDSKGNLKKNKEDENAAVKRLKAEIYELDALMMKHEQESNESWEKERNRKQIEAEKRFIPDNQWKLIVGIVGSVLVVSLIYYTLWVFTFLLTGSG